MQACNVQPTAGSPPSRPRRWARWRGARGGSRRRWRSMSARRGDSCSSSRRRLAAPAARASSGRVRSGSDHPLTIRAQLHTRRVARRANRSELVQRQVDQDPTATHITTHGRRITHATSPPACPAGPTWFIVQGMLHSASIHAQKPAPERSTDAHIVPCATRRDTSSHVSPPLTQPFRRNSCRDGRARLGHIEYVRLEKLPATRRFSAGSGISGISVAGVRTAGGSPKWP